MAELNMWVLLCLFSFVCVAQSNVFKGNVDFLDNVENSKTVNDALLAVLISNAAAFSLYSKLVDRKNVVFSPLSISNVLGMIYMGSGDMAAHEFEDALGFNSTFIHKGLKSIRESTMDSVDCDVHSVVYSNALVVCNNYSLPKEYEMNIETFYNTSILKYPNDTNPAYIVNLVNSWILNATKGKMKSITKQAPTTFSSVMLLSSVYFKAPWKYPFSHEKTVKKNFYNFGYRPTEVMMMRRNLRALYGYNPSIDSFLLELPYDGLDLSMLILMPNIRSGFHVLEKQMNLEVYNVLHEAMYKTDIDIEIPRFKLWHTMKLPHILKSMGITNIFSGNADLSGISPDGQIYISEMIHKSTFDVSEAGTEAAGATSATIQTMSMKPTFFVNQPFMFIIRHKWTGAILFLGRVLEL